MLEPLPALEPRLPAPRRFARDLPRGAALGWLSCGWADLWARLTEAPDRAVAINLDKGDLLAGALADLARVKRMAG